MCRRVVTKGDKEINVGVETSVESLFQTPVCGESKESVSIELETERVCTCQCVCVCVLK